MQAPERGRQLPAFDVHMNVLDAFGGNKEMVHGIFFAGLHALRQSTGESVGGCYSFDAGQKKKATHHPFSLSFSLSLPSRRVVVVVVVPPVALFLRRATIKGTLHEFSHSIRTQPLRTNMLSGTEPSGPADSGGCAPTSSVRLAKRIEIET